MKKSLFYIAAASLALVSCNEEELVNAPVSQAKGVLTATFNQDAATRTSINGDSNNALTWSTGDAIAVFSGSQESAATVTEYTLTDGQGSASGTFEGDEISENKLGAVFPYSTNAELNGGVLSIELPNDITQTGSELDVPMWGEIKDDNISFKHLAGLLKVNLTGILDGYKKLTVTADKPISGAFTATLNGEGEEPVLKAASDNTTAGNTVTVTFTAATSENKNAVLYLPLPTGEYESIVVSVSNEDGTNSKVLKQFSGINVERAKVYSTTVTDYTSVMTEAELRAAIAKEGEVEVVLGSNITLSECLKIDGAGKVVLLDLNGKILDTKDEVYDVLRITGDGAKVTIKNGTIDNQNGENYALSVRANNVELTMEKVTIPANDYDGSLHNNGNYSGSTFTLTNCTFNGTVYLSNTDNKAANTLVVSGGSFTAVEENCFNLLNIDATITGATLTCNNAEQSYQVNGNEGNNFSNPLGYCVAFSNVDGTPAKGKATLSDNTYAIADKDGDYIFNQMDGATLNMEVSRFNEFATVAAAGGEIKLLNDIGNAEGLAINKNLVVDFGGMTYTMSKPGAGSTGTQTLGFQLLQGNNITLKNGTINCSVANKDCTWDSDDTEKGIAMMIQNYANLTLENMTIDGTNIAHNGDNMRYIVSNNSGTVNLTGSTSITAPAKDVAFDVCNYASYTAPKVTVNTTGTITGLVEVSGGTLNVTAGTFKNGTGHCVKVVSGNANFNGGDFEAQEVSVFNLAGTVKITDGTFTSNDNAVISGNGTNDDKYKNGTIEISGGTFNAKILSSGYVACGIYHPQEGTLEVTGGTFNIENGCGILMRGGSLNMTNSKATFTFTGDATEANTGKVGDSRVVVPCRKKIVKDACSAYYDAANIKIEGVNDSDIYEVEK